MGKTDDVQIGALVGLAPVLPPALAPILWAIANATPRGLGIVEDAINTAITSIEDEVANLKKEEFGVNGFIPKSSFGSTDRSSEMALHHTKAHAVVEETLSGVLADLVRFRDACVDAREDIKSVDRYLATDFDQARTLVDGLLVSTTSGQDARDAAVQGNPDVAPTDDNPYEEG